MNKSLEKALLKQRIRRSHGLVISEQATLYSTFVEPFTDAVSAIKLGTQDILNQASLAWTTFFSISPKKLEEAREKYEERRDKIAEKWKPIMDRSVKALQRGDADLLALAFAPGLTLAAATTQAAVSAAGGTVKFLGDAGWKVPLLSGLGFTIDIDEKPDSDTSSSSSGGNEEKSLLQKLAGLFYIEHAWLSGELITEGVILEQEESGNFKEELNNWLLTTGVAAKFEETAMELIDANEEAVKSIVDEVLAKMEILNKMSQAKDLEEFTAAVEEAERSGVEIQINSEELKKKVEDSAKELIKTPEYEKSVSDLASKKGMDAEKQTEKPESEKIEDASKTVFIQMKKDFDDKVQEQIEELKSVSLEAVSQYEPDDENKSKIRTTKLGLRFLKIFDDAKLSIKNS